MKINRTITVIICLFCGLALLVFGMKLVNQRQYKTFSATFKRELSDINNITILDGNTGEKHDIDDWEIIRLTTEAFQRAEYKINPSKEMSTGFTYAISFYDADGTIIFDPVVTKRTIYSNKSSYVIKVDISDTLDYIKELLEVSK